jgi:hypothetical protein
MFFFLFPFSLSHAQTKRFLDPQFAAEFNDAADIAALTKSVNETALPSSSMIFISERRTSLRLRRLWAPQRSGL